MRSGALALLALLLAMGCDGIGEAPPGACEAAGERCPLGDGPVGVCERAPCADSDREPCFVCTPQH
jgi:hypothetical protein